MNFVLLGLTSALDAVANALVFSGALSANFYASEVAEFSTMLAWAAVISAAFFGGAEQLIDHRKTLPGNFFLTPQQVPWLFIPAIICSVLLASSKADIISGALLLAVVLGLRNIGRAAVYARRKYWQEFLITSLELVCLALLTRAALPLLNSYVLSRLVGLTFRLSAIDKLNGAPISRLDMMGYSFSALAPAVYFNLYYAMLPIFAQPDTIVRFRYVQSLLVPMSFLGSLFARARIVFDGNAGKIITMFDFPARSQGWLSYSISALFPVLLSCSYINMLSLFVVDITLQEMFAMTLYCSLIYHRSQLYSHITLRLGAATRARVAMFGILLLFVSFLAVGFLGGATVKILFVSLCVVETCLLGISAFLLIRAQA